MSKNIVVCCDGTGNGFENPDSDSNVVKLYSTPDFSDIEPRVQPIFPAPPLAKSTAAGI